MAQKKQFHSLTALKGLFILIIVFHNTLSIHPLFASVPGSSFIILFGGKLGNCMFFMLSGFLFACNYRDRIASRSVSFSDYLRRRLIRLYPLYFLSNAVSLLIAIMQHGVSVINLKNIVLSLFLQVGGGLENGNPYNSPTWFLSSLFVCYIAFFFVCFFFRQPTAYYCAIAFGITWGYLLQKAGWQLPFCYEETGLGLLNFFVGCALVELFAFLKNNYAKKRIWLQIAGISVLLLSFFLMLRYGVEIICGDTRAAFTFFVCPLVLFLASEGPCASILSLKPFVWLGEISTSLFFWHLPIFYLFRMAFFCFMPDMPIGESHYLFYLFLTIICCTLSCFALEKKVLHHR